MASSPAGPGGQGKGPTPTNQGGQGGQPSTPSSNRGPSQPGGQGPGQGSGGGTAAGVPVVARGGAGKGVRPIPPGSAPSRPAISRPTTHKSPLPGVRESEPGEGHENETVLQRTRRLASSPNPNAEPGEGAGDSLDTAVLAGGEGAEGQGDSTDSQVTPVEGTRKFKFAGREYATQAEAENAHKAAEGRASAAEKRFRTVEGQLQKLLAINQQWEQRYNQVTQQPGQQPTQPGQQPGQTPISQNQSQQPQQPAQVQNFVDAIAAKEPAFWDHVKQVAEQHGPHTALAYTLQHFETHSQARVDAAIQKMMTELAPVLHPIYTEQVQRAQQDQATKLWADFASYKKDMGDGADGSPYFPELANNPQAQREVAHFWLTLGNTFGKEFAMSEYGIHRAYLDWSSWKQSKAQAVTGAAEAANEVVQRLEQERSQSAQMGISPGSSAQSPNPGQVPTSQDDVTSLRRAIASAPVGGKGRTTSTGIDLGFRS